MGSYTFRWEHPAEEVFVTGTFDDWKKSTKLDKVGSAHEKTVEIPSSSDKILYKFVADGDWKHDPTAKTEQDHEGNTNNVLYPDDIKPSGASALTFSSVGPGATTTAMAGEQSVERSTPGAFPETPAANDDQTFSVNPIPASEGVGNPIQLIPGEPVPSSSGNISSGVHDDPELKSKAEGEQTFGVAPIPASSGIGNPIQLTPGEPVPDPSTINSNTVDSTAKTDQASYERSDASPPVMQSNSGTLQDRVGSGTGVLGGLGPVIPESSMAMGNTSDINNEDTGPTVSSVAPGSTTTELAGQVPKEPRGTPTVIKSSNEQDSADPTMSSVAPGATTAALAGAQPVEQRGEPTVIKDSEEEAKNNPTISTVGAGATTAALAGEQPKEGRGVPEVVSESQQEAKVDPEASANPGAVEEKKEVEAELMKEVPEAPSTSESGMLGKSEDGVGAKAAAGVAAAGVAAAGAAVAANEMIKDKTGTDAKAALPQSVQDKVDEQAKESSIPQKAAESSSTDAARETTTTVPAEVKESQEKAGEPAEASASPDAVKEKAEAEKELLSKVKESEAKGEPAPTESAAAAESAPAATSSSGAPQLDDPTLGVQALSLEDKNVEGSGDGGRAVDKTPTPLDSRDVSPMSRPATQQEPQVTTGVASSSAPEKSAAQKRQSLVEKLKNYKPDSPESSKTGSKPATPGTSESKKKENRRSFFSKLKEKLNRKSNSDADETVECPQPPKDKAKAKAIDEVRDFHELRDFAETIDHDDISNSPIPQSRIRNIHNSSTTTVSSASIPSPPPHLPPRKSKSNIDPKDLPKPYVPRPSWMNPPVRRHRLQLPESSDEASMLSRANSKANRTGPNTDPSPAEKSSIQNSDQFTVGDYKAVRAERAEPSTREQLQRRDLNPIEPIPETNDDAQLISDAADTALAAVNRTAESRGSSSTEPFPAFYHVPEASLSSPDLTRVPIENQENPSMSDSRPLREGTFTQDWNQWMGSRFGRN